MTDDWVVAAGLFMGAAAVTVGTCVRLGGCRRFLRSYFQPELPAYLRNGILAAIPSGLFFLLGMVGVSSIEAYGEAAMPVAAPLMFGSLASAVVGMWWLFAHQSGPSRPRLRAEEQADAAGLPVPDRRPAPLSPAMWVAGWIVLALLVIAGLIVSVPLGPLLMGLGIGGSLLVAQRPGADVQPTRIDLAQRKAEVDAERARAVEARARADSGARQAHEQ